MYNVSIDRTVFAAGIPAGAGGIPPAAPAPVGVNAAGVPPLAPALAPAGAGGCEEVVFMVNGGCES